MKGGFRRRRKVKGVYDQAARFAARSNPESVPQRLVRGRGVSWRFREWFDTRTVPLPGGPDRVADLVAALDDPLRAEKPWLVVLEFQTEPDEEKLDGTLEVVAILRHRVRHGDERQGKYKVVAGLIHLQGRCCIEQLDMTLPDGSGTRYAPLIWNVAEDDALTTLDRVASGELSWGMLFWVPLMKGGGSEEVIARWKEMLVARIEEKQSRADIASIAFIFAELVGSRIQWKRALEDTDMTESQVVNEWIRSGVIKDRRNSLIELLETRFPEVVPSEVKRLIQDQDSFELLQDWFRAAARATTFEDFMDELRR